MREIRPCNSKNLEIKPCNSEIRSIKIKPCNNEIGEINKEQGISDSCLALEQAYRCKSAYKLLQMDKELKFLKSAKSVLDLCAAPGGWMEVALDKIPEGGFVLGVDHLPIRAIPGAISVVEDITTAKSRAAIARQMRINGVKTFDVVLFDGSPTNVGGAKAEEAMTTLVINSIQIATEFLSPGGTLVTKIFQSRGSNAVIKCLGHLFGKVKTSTPPASSGTSEFYVVGTSFKASLEIHPRLFDVKYIFDVEHENRNGKYTYGDPKRILPVVPAVRRNVSASTFLWSKSPRDILNRAASFSFDDPYLKDHSLTTDKVKFFCKDLLVLGKQEHDLLLEWRMHMLKSLSSSHETTTPKASFPKDEIEGDADLISDTQAKDESCQSIGMRIDALEDGYAGHEKSSSFPIKGTTGGSAGKGEKRRRV